MPFFFIFQIKMETFKGYNLEKHSIEIDGRIYTIAMVHNAYDLLDKIDPKTFAEDEKMPYWAEIWSGSIVLSKWILSRKFDKQNRFLEIGAGVGGLSAILTSNGYQCMATDYDEDALEFCKLNAELNGGLQHLRTSFLDWRKPHLKEKFEFIIGSDIIYEVRNILPILDVVRINLKPGGKFFFSDPGRRPMSHLKVLAAEADFKLSVVYQEQFKFRHSDQLVSIYCLEM